MVGSDVSVDLGLCSQECRNGHDETHGLDVAEGQALVYNGVANQFYSTRYQRREDCLSHETYPEPIVDHPTARAEALAAYEQIKAS